MGLKDAPERISTFISLRELFKLLPLPPKYRELDLTEVSKSWEHNHVVVRLLLDTYRSSQMSGQNRIDPKYIQDYHIECPGMGDAGCPRSKTILGKKYEKESLPRIPLHIGCCCIQRENHISRLTGLIHTTPPRNIVLPNTRPCGRNGSLVFLYCWS